MKSKKELVYKKGLAVQILEVEETASEYSQDCNYKMKLFFKSKNAISKACSILGYKLDKKRATEAFLRGRNGFEVNMDAHTYFVIEKTFECIGHIGRYGYRYYFNNHYTSRRVSEIVNPVDIYRGISEDTLDINLGSCANSEGTFKEALENVLKNIDEGRLYYCPSLS